MGSHCNTSDTFDMNLIFLIICGQNIIERDAFLVEGRTYLRVKNAGVNRRSQFSWGITIALVSIQKNPPKQVNRIAQ